MSHKLFPKTVGFEMNLEDKLIVIQILNCWMRLTSIRWQSRAWKKYKKFTDFAEMNMDENMFEINGSKNSIFQKGYCTQTYLIMPLKIFQKWPNMS